MKRKILAAVFLTVTATSAFTGTDLILAAEKTEETAVQKPDMEGIDTENTKIGISIYQFEDTFMTLYRTELVRYLTEEQVPEQVDFFSVDVSFISLGLVLPAARPFLREGGEAVCLIKPQFEAGREKVGKKGVVRDKAVHREVIEKVVNLALSGGYSPLGLTYSPVKGPEGNIEYLLYLRREESPHAGDLPDVAALVEESHQVLNGGDAP